MLTEHCKLRVSGVEYGFLSTQLKMDVPATSLRGHLSQDISSAVVVCQPRCRWEALYTRNTIHYHRSFTSPGGGRDMVYVFMESCPSILELFQSHPLGMHNGR